MRSSWRVEKRSAVRLSQATQKTFKDVAVELIDAQKAGWKSAKHAGQWLSTLKTYAFPVIGDLPIAQVDGDHILTILQPIWTKKPETASRVRGRIERVLDRARALKLRAGENPARWTGHLDELLPAKAAVRPVEHHTALPYQELPAFMVRLRARQGVSARALEFTILTAARTGETIGAKWSEISDGLWTIPGSRMKGRKGRERQHTVPLSGAVLELLEGLPRVNEYLFPGAIGGISNMAMAECLKHLHPGAGATVHGFRSTFRDWVADETEYANELAEMALAHVVSDKTEKAYRRGSMLQRRRQLMEDWSAYCEGKAVGGDNVVAIGARK